MKTHKKQKIDLRNVNQEILSKILTHVHLKTVKTLMLSSTTLRKKIRNNSILWKHIANENSISIKSCIEIVKNRYTIQKNIKRAQNEHVLTFNTKQKYITHIEVTKTHVICSSDDNSVKMFNFMGKEELCFLGHRGGIWTFMQSDKYLVTGSIDKTARIWDIKKGYTLNILQGHTSTIRTLKFFGDYICTGGRDSIIRVWNFSGECLHVLRHHTESVRVIDMDGNYLVSGSYDGSVVMWDYTKGKKLFCLKRHKKKVYSVRLGTKYVVSSGLDGYVHISNLEGKLVTVYKNHNDIVAWLSFSNNERYLISSGADHCICKWDIENSSLVYKIEEESAIASHAVSNELLFVASQTEVKVYDYIHGVFIRTLMEAQQIIKLEIFENKIVIGFLSYGEYQIRIYKYL